MMDREPSTRVQATGIVRLDSLTSLRFVAALMVFAIHCSGLLRFRGIGYHELSLIIHTTKQGTAGVSFFFILSGFVLTWSHREGDRPFTFWRRRVARIVPAYWLTWCAGLIIIGASVPTAIIGFLLLQAWFPISRYYFAGNGVAWSLSCEAFFYALFPLLLVLFRRYLSPKRQTWALGAVTVFIVAWPLLWHATIDKGIRYWVTFIFPPARLPEFCLGMLLGLAMRRGARSRIPLGVALVLAAAGYLAAGFVPNYATWSAVTVIPFAILIYSAASADLEQGSSLLHRRWLVRLGEWSYCFYLIHDLVLRVVSNYVKDHHYFIHHLARSFSVSLVAVTGAFVVSVVLAGVVYTLWERPLEKRIRGKGPPRLTMAS
ncbi:MAG TPA: acyltransferase [Acidimicrobiales bacterium]|nr:acyltransferase [Acidimicrobiales bacterium]